MTSSKSPDVTSKTLNCQNCFDRSLETDSSKGWKSSIGRQVVTNSDPLYSGFEELKGSNTHIIGVVCRHPNSSYEYLPDKLQLTIADLNETN